MFIEYVLFSEFIARLKKHYNDTLSHVSVSTLLPSGDESLNKLYAAPSISRIAENSDGENDTVSTYKEILYTGEKLNKRIFLQGEAGMGKTTFATKLILDWCNQVEASSLLPEKKPPFHDASTMQEFKLALFISLRDSAIHRDVTKMIKEQIIDLMYAETERDEAYLLLNKLMQTERCLVVQDGLDEWRDPEGKLAQPFLISCYSQCTMLTTTRPWKLTDERIKKSQIDSLFELKGIRDPYILCKNVLDSSGCFTLETFDDLKTYVEENGLHGILLSPMLLSLIVCSWLDGIRLTRSICEVYCVLIDGLFKKASDGQSFFTQPPLRCFRNTRYFQQNMEHLHAISKTAFLMMFSAEREQSLVISDQHLAKYMQQEHKEFALKTGILSERKSICRTYQRSTCSFIHKSVQEFLAAVYISFNDGDLGVVSRYITENSDAIFENMIFIFLCGLKISAANEFSCTIDSIIDKYEEYEFESFTALYISGFLEAQRNVQNLNEINLKLSQIYITEHVNMKDVLSIIRMNMSNAKHLRLDYPRIIRQERRFDLSPFRFENLKVLELSCECNSLDLTSCHNLECVSLRDGITVQSTAFRGLSKLESLKMKNCGCEGLDLSSCPNLETINLYADELGKHFTLIPGALNGLAKLKSLKIKNCKFKEIDMSSCVNLESIIIRRGGTLKAYALHGLAKLNNLVMEIIECTALDLSSCHNLENIDLRGEITLIPTALHGLTKLKNLKVKYCEGKGLDLSSCQYLENIDLRGEITLIPTALHGLTKLKNLKMKYCECKGLDLSSCHSLEIIHLRGKITLLPTSFHKLEKLTRLVMKDCWCEGLDLSSCQNLETIDLCKKFTLTPAAFHGLAKLTTLMLKDCVVDQLHLSCHKKEIFDTKRNITLIPDSIPQTFDNKEIVDELKSERLDLSSCHNLDLIYVKGDIAIDFSGLKKLRHLIINSFNGLTIIFNDICSLEMLRELKLYGCRCEILDLSACTNLQTIHIEGDITLLSKGFLNLQQLEELELNCFCDGLDLSACYNLYKVRIFGTNFLTPSRKRAGIDLLNCLYDVFSMDNTYKFNGNITLLSNGFNRLTKLKYLQLHCKCNSLDLSSCSDLRKLELGSDIILLSRQMPRLKCLNVLILCNECDGLDISSYQELYLLYIGEHVTLLPEELRAPDKLKYIFMCGKSDGLDLSSCKDLIYIFIGKQINFTTFGAHNHKKIKHLKLCSKCESLDLSGCHQLRTLFLTESTAVSLSSVPYFCLVELCLMEPVQLLPNLLSSLQVLQHLTLGCNCKDFDVLLCRRLKTLTLVKPVTISLNVLQHLQMLECLIIKPAHDVFNLTIDSEYPLFSHLNGRMENFNYLDKGFENSHILSYR
ncbi:hypothetical protein DPMN_101119 [Dreissena polymorpha]|uniref:NACHT domain-containing protein n=1 Tax=Dreissena polymorpha TaxID=45954 RepID=A0A9D4R815_DREPO|nr:hypothetical protein DPMN_101119 [Dreissena polymorpha]